MKLAKFFIAATSAAWISVAIGCNDESEVVPEITPTPKAEAVQPAKAPVEAPPPKSDSMPVLQPIESLSSNSQPNETFSLGNSEAAEAAAPGKEGQITIQVSIQPSKRNAQAVLKQLEEKGIRGYLAEVENPGELEGTYYRVRVGFFKTTDAARAFGKASLEPLGFAWWIDNRANDKVGSPESGESATYNQSDSYNHSGAYTESSGTAPVEEPAPVEESIPTDSPVAQEASSQATEQPTPAQPSEAEQPAPAEQPAAEQAPEAAEAEAPVEQQPAPAAEQPPQEQAPAASEEVYDDWESF